MAWQRDISFTTPVIYDRARQDHGISRFYPVTTGSGYPASHDLAETGYFAKNYSEISRSHTLW